MAESPMMAEYHAAHKSRWSMIEPPVFSDAAPLRILLLGKSMSENSHVGNLILGRSAFDSEAPPCVLERVGGRLKDRHVTLINSPQLLHTNISDDQITQTVRECVSLSDPGPHVFIIVLQYGDFTKEDMSRVKNVLRQFNEKAIRQVIMITTDEKTHDAIGSPVKVNETIQKFSAECGERHLQLDKNIEEWRTSLLQQTEKILRENSEEFRSCDSFDESEGTSVDEPDTSSYSLGTEEEDSDEEDDGKACKTQTEKKEAKGFLRNMPIRSFFSNPESRTEHDQAKGIVRVTKKQKLNLMLCGSDGRLKASVSKLIRGKKTFLSSLPQKECVSKAVDLYGRQINVLELPALSRLSEEEVMRQSHQCVSLCDPGVHAFLFIIPDAPLTEEDKAEMEKIQKIFSSRINKHVIVLIMQEKNILSKLISSRSHFTHIDTSIQTLGARWFVLENRSQIPDLLQDVENMVQENRGSFYSSFMFLQAQLELAINKYKAEIEELKRSMMKTQSAAGLTHADDLRIVLLGKTGVGKSASANTILKRKSFKSVLTSQSVTKECQKDTTEFNTRCITVIDTPGLFDTGVDNVETMKAIVKCVSMAAPGPHVFLLVIPLGRFTKEEKDAVKMIQERFGDQSSMYTMVLFTRGDDLRGTRIEDFIEGDRSLQNLIHQCGNRYHVFNNKKTKDQTQVSELLEKIDRMVAVNGGGFYTNEMFQLVEKNIREKQERILKEKEEEIKRREEELRDKYEAEIEQMKKETETKQKEMQDELRKKEEEFKKKEEDIKKEKDESLQKELQRNLEEQQKQLEEENKRKEKALEEQQQNFIKYLEEKHEKEKQNLKERIQRETREQAEQEYREKLEQEVAKALREAEEQLPQTARRAREWSLHAGFIGAFAGSFVGFHEDIVSWIISFSQAQRQTEG